MTVRISNGLAKKMLDGGATGGAKAALALGFLNFYSGPQPLTADTGATGTLLGTASVNAGGTGLTFDAAVLNVLSKAAAEAWKFLGLNSGTIGYCRFYPAGGDPTILSTTEARIDAACATSGSDVDVSNISVTLNSPHTVDTYSLTMPLA